MYRVKAVLLSQNQTKSMKKLFGFILIIAGVSLSSCSKEAEASLQTAYGFTIENIMGEEVSIKQDWNSRAIIRNGYSHSDGAKKLRGTYVAGCLSSLVDKQTEGFEFHLIYTFSEEEYKDEFTNKMFKSLWYEGKIHKLGINGEDLFDNPFIYIGIKNEEGELQKYVTEVNASDDNSHLEITSMEYAGKGNKDRDIYEVKVKYESRLVNMDDETDVIYLKDGLATLKVSNFGNDIVK